MAVIDELVIAFASDNSKLNSGLKQGEQSINQFADNANKKFAALGEGIKTAFKAYFSFAALKNLTFDFAKATGELADKAQMVGASAGEVQALGNALEHFGGNSDDAVNSMKSLNSAMIQLRTTGGGAIAEVAKKFGLMVKPAGTGKDALIQIGGQLSKLSTKNRIAVAQQLGLSDSLVRAFADGGEELSKLLARQEELGTVTEEDVKASRKFNSAWLDLQDSFAAIQREIARVLLPIMTKIVNLITGFADFLRKHKAIMVGFFVALAIAMAPVLVSLTAMIVKMTILALPFLKIAAIVTAIVLVFEDLYYYFNGWDSATGDLVKKFPFLAKFLEPIRPIVLGIMEVFEKIVNFLKDPSWSSLVDIIKEIGAVALSVMVAPFKFLSQLLDSLIAEFPSLGVVLEPIKAVVDWIVGKFEYLVELVKSFSLDNLVKGFDAIGDKISGAVDSVADFFGFGGGDKKAASNEGEAGWEGTSFSYGFGGGKPPAVNVDKVEIKGDAPLMPAQSSVINNNSTTNGAQVTNNNTFNNNYNVSTATPKEFVAQAAPAMIRSIDAQTQQMGRL